MKKEREHNLSSIPAVWHAEPIVSFFSGIMSDIMEFDRRWFGKRWRRIIRWNGKEIGRPPYNPGYVMSPFPLLEEDQNEKIKIYDMWESGSGFTHTCKYGRIPHNVAFQPFLPAGRKWPRGGEEGYEATIRITLVGCVDQDTTPGRWKWVSRQKYDFELPWSLRKILGKVLKVDTWLEIRGEKAVRDKKKDMRWMETEDGRMQRAMPKGTKLEVEWDELIFPSPGRGIIIWGVFAQLIKLQGLGLTKEF